MNFEMKIRNEDGELETLTFWAPDGGGYVRQTFEHKPGTRGLQICEGGSHTGNCLECGPSEESLAKVCRKWRRQQRDNDRKSSRW